jgi:hypothetical protein
MPSQITVLTEQAAIPVITRQRLQPVEDRMAAQEKN